MVRLLNDVPNRFQSGLHLDCIDAVGDYRVMDEEFWVYARLLMPVLAEQPNRTLAVKQVSTTG